MLKEKRMSDEEGDFRYHEKKDKELENTRKCSCGKMCKCGKKCSCGKTMSESKFDKYLIEAKEEQDQLKEDLMTEGTMNPELRKEIIALGIPVPSSLTVDAYNNLLKRLADKPEIVSKLKSDKAMIWSNVEAANRAKFN